MTEHQLKVGFFVQNLFRYDTICARRLEKRENRRRVVRACEDVDQELDRETRSATHFDEALLAVVGREAVLFILGLERCSGRSRTAAGSHST